MFLSNGTLVGKSVLWEGTPAQWHSSPRFQQFQWASYGQIYREQLWVSVVVNKRAGMVSRLPLKVYSRDGQGRTEQRDHPLARLLRRPNARQDPFLFWSWTTSTWDIYGEAFWGKVRERGSGGRPVQLLPLHPTCMTLEEDGTWTYRSGKIEVTRIPSTEIVHFQSYNPDSLHRGMSKLEPLRRTLENEDYSRRATSAFWRNGARPGFALAHPGALGEPAQVRLRAQWDEMVGGADNTGRTLILEEGMKPEKLSLSAEEAQYIEGRKLNREEVVAAYDMPPPAVHILDRATFSNITEQFRSVYRDTMAPVLDYFEAVIATQLRDSPNPRLGGADFGDDVYAEFLMDEVLRGSFEARQQAYRQADYMTVAEKRQLENLPFIAGTDRIVINAATIPLDMLDAVTQARTETGNLPVVAARGVLGRLSRQKHLSEVSVGALVADLAPEDAETVRKTFALAVAAGEDVQALRARLKAIAGSD